MVKIIFFDGYIIIVDLGILIFSEINEIKSFIFIVILNNFFNIVWVGMKFGFLEWLDGKYFVWSFIVIIM